MSCFFIGGINRSGTTLLQSILCSDKTTNPLIHEASYVRNIVEAYITGCKKFNEHNKYYFDSTDDLKYFTSRWLEEFLNKLRKRYPQSQHLVLKHPPLTPLFPWLYKLLISAGEDPYFYISVRDPRDVAASLIQVGERLRSKGESEGNTLPRNMALIGNYYMQCYIPALSSNDIEFKSRINIIKYEDLVSNPDETLDRIRVSSGLKLNEYDKNSDWKNDNIDYNNLKNNDNAWLSSLWGKKLSNSRVGIYKNVLSPVEIKELENVCSGPLVTFKYK
jgi:hypothetical protein